MFVHLHNHTHYSLLDGLTRPKEAIEIAKQQGSPAIAITDHGVLYGVIEFYKAGKEQGIKPLIGCEMYVAPEGRLKKEPHTPINHLTVIAYTTEGYHNLIQLVSKAHLEGFYYKPRVDHGLLKEFHRGLLALSGCLSSEVSEAILAGNMEKALAKIKFYQELFGKENFFLEMMDHPEMQEQLVVRNTLIQLASEANAPLVATNDNHYARREDNTAHDLLLCIQTGKTVQDQNRMKLDGNYSIRSPEEMSSAFADCPEAIQNTVEIASRCSVDIPFGKNLIPMFQTPDGASSKEYLRTLCEAGFLQRYGKSTPAGAKERLEYELGVIHTAGFDTYFLIVHDLVQFAKKEGVIVGPGRGSAAGSIVSYCLNITTVDPLQYGLLFERFLNPDRVSMPDIDIDFDDERRAEVLEYVVKKYGRENVAQIITFGTMAARAAVRDVGRVMGYPYTDVDRLAKLVPPPIQGRHTPLKISIEDDPDLKKAYTEEPKNKSLLDMAMKLEGTVRHAGTHACAVVISKEPLSHYTPLQRPTGEDTGVITQYSMKPLEDLGLLKMDFLGLRNLTILKRAVEIIEDQRGKRIALDDISLDDAETFKLLAAGETTGVFQLESGGMRRYLKELEPTDFNAIIAMVALYRPGPMPWIPMYIKGKHNPSKVKYLHKSFEPFLKETYGVAVYQEQILKITRDFTGMSLGEVDILRKAVGKKDPKLLSEQREKFIEGAIHKKGHPAAFAEKVFDEVIEPFAAYGFNKSHAACYGLIAYQTAYLKANYPTEFMAALLSTDSENTDRVAIEVERNWQGTNRGYR
ncbi:MAG: polymerase III, alpha subunit protein [Candidatus Peregrinibacteria bacterium GW2011_GWA2_47_7]|nr:MAG: polymerase III, alpha subunit protein [Candidatus Peregrinibacteria bacterium GW2011_GWA2_47_7]